MNLFRLVQKLIVDSPSPDELHDIDPEMVKLVIPVVSLLRSYFRGEVAGLENMPGGKALIVGNHNAGITFFEPFIMALEWYKRKPEEALYFLAHDIMLSLPVVKNLLIKTGSIRASHKMGHKAFERGKKVVVYPGGNYEAFRPYSERHKVDFGGKKGFIKLALREQVPIVPVANVGGHETFFVITPGHLLARLTGVKRFLRSESFPIFLGLPWIIGLGPIFHLPLPAKLNVRIGKPISLEGYKPEDADNREVTAAIYQKVTAEIQSMVDDLAKNRKYPIIG